MNSRTVAILVLLMSVSALATATALAVLGKWHDLFGLRFSAEIQLHDVTVPISYDIDPVMISDEMVSRMTERTETDIAVRILLNSGQNELLRERVIPRLVNAGVIRRMLRDMEGLGTVIEYATYQSYAQIRIENRDRDALTDVALLLPHTKRVESLNQAAFEFRAIETEIGAISLPLLQGGEAVDFNVWLDATPTEIVAQKTRVLLGAEGGVRGDVRLYGAASEWNGADLEILSWARWLIALFCVAIAFAATAAVVLTIAARLRGRAASNAPDATDVT